MDIVTYALLNGKIKDYASNVDEWLEENVDPATGYVLDRSLQMENAAAPADMVGDINDEVGNLKNTINQPIRNLLEQNKKANEKIINSSGVEVTDPTGYYFKQYIPVDGVSNVMLLFTPTGTGSIHRLYFFDESKALLSRPVVGTGTLMPIPTDAKYVSVQGHYTDTSIALQYVNKDESLQLQTIEETINLFDESSLINGKIINDSGSETAGGSSSYYCHYISVVPESKYEFSFTAQKIYEYDEDMNFIRRVNGTALYSCPAGVHYIQVQIANGNISVANKQVSLFDSANYFVEYGLTAKDKMVRTLVETCNLNLFNQKTLKENYIKNDSGVETTDVTSSYYTQYVEVEPGKDYFINFAVQKIYQFDGNKSNIVRTESSLSTTAFGVYHVPSWVHFIQIQCRNDNISLFPNKQISEGIDPVAYIPFNAITAIDYVARAKTDESGTGEYSGRTFQLFPSVNYWEPSSADSGYSNPTSGDGRDTERADWTAEDKYLYYEFLAHYYDPYIGNSEDGYKVTKRSLGQDSANTGHELFEYTFSPVDYKYTVLLSAGMNADETQGIWGLATFIKCLMDREETNIAIMHDNIRFKIIPIINASGFDEALLRYTYSDGVNPNFNFNYIDSWYNLPERTQWYANKGAYPDSNISTRYLKTWLNENSGKADLWVDIHTGRWDTALNKIIIDIRTADASLPSIFNQYGDLIKSYYMSKGYISNSDNIGSATNIRSNMDYQKTVYAFDVCGIKSMMSEMHLESTGYGADGYTNNTPNGIKCYVGLIRMMIIAYINDSADASPLIIDDVKSVSYHSRY